MNIFVLDQDPTLAAQYQCDKHIVKMILETAILLSAAMRINNDHRAPYGPGQEEGHICAEWAATSRWNFRWLKSHGLALSAEYTKRYGKVHRCLDTIRSCRSDAIPSGDLTGFVQAMPIHCQQADPVEAYRYYYNTIKYRIAVWTNRDPPAWFQPHRYIGRHE